MKTSKIKKEKPFQIKKEKKGLTNYLGTTEKAPKAPRGIAGGKKPKHKGDTFSMADMD